MKSGLRGRNTSRVGVSSISPDGFWLLVDKRELFVPFKEFPWFEDATVRQIAAVERPSPHHLRWPDLDVDLALESIEHPERFPLRSPSGNPSPPSRSARRRSPAAKASATSR